MSEFSQERRIDRGSGTQEKKGDDSKTNHRLSSPNYLGPGIAIAGSVGIALLSITSNKSNLVKLAGLGIAAAGGTLALGAAFAKAKGDD